MDKESNAAPGTSQATKKIVKSPAKSKAVKKTAAASGKNNATSTKDKPTEPKAAKKAVTAVPGTSGVDNTVTKKPAKQPIEAKAEKKTMLDLVCEAIGVVGERRKGASVQAIKKYITGNAENGTARQNTLVNRALIKGIEKGILSRPAVSKNVKGATGHFTLAKKEKPKKEKADAENHDIEDYMSDSEITKKPAKPRKRVLSDSDANKLPGAITSTPRPPKFKKPAISKDPQITKKAPVKKEAAVKKNATETTSENKNKPASSETFAKATKESRKKTEAGKQKTEKQTSQAKAAKTEKQSSQAKATKTEKQTSQAKVQRSERTRKLFHSEEK